MTPLHADVSHRMFDAHKRVRARLRRAVRALECAQVSYAVTGDQAVGAWIASIDPGGVRGTPEVEILVEDLRVASAALLTAGFVNGTKAGMFLEEPTGSAREAVLMTPAASLPRLEFFPDADGGFNAVDLDGLVRTQLQRNGLTNRINVRDMLDVGLIDQAWMSKLPSELGARLQCLIDTPEG